MKPAFIAATSLIKANLGKRIRALRLKKGWSQTIMAALCGIHVSHLSKVERGGVNPTLSTLVAFAAVLQVDISDLLQNTNIRETIASTELPAQTKDLRPET